MEERLPIPVALRILIQRCEHDWQYRFDVIADQVAKVLIVPEVQSTFGNLMPVLELSYRIILHNAHLKMRTGH